MTHYLKVQGLRGILVLFLFILVQVGCANYGAQDEIAITTKSEEARKLFLEGRELFDDVRFDEARDLFSKAIAADPDFSLAHLNRSFTSTSTADFQKHLDKAVALAPNASEGERLLIEATQANADNNAVKAVELCEQLVQKFPNDKRAHQTLGFFYSGQNEDDKAIAEYEKAIELDKDFASVYNSLGYAYIQKKEYEKSEAAFKNYIRLIPDEANPHDSIADLYTKMGRNEDAIEHFKKSVELNPKFTMSQRKIGTNLVFMGKYDEGRAAYHKAIEMEMTPAAKVTDMNQIARSYLYEGHIQQAFAEFDKSLKMAMDANLDAAVANIHSQKCLVSIESGDLDAAEKSLAECKKTVEASDLRQSFKDNFNKGALFQAALIAAKKNDFETALAKADEHLAKIEADNNPIEMQTHHDLLGHIAFLKGDYADAIEHFKQGNQEDAYTLYHLALSETEAGDNEKAAELLKTVADWNENSLSYAFVKSDAAARVQMATK